MNDFIFLTQPENTLDTATSDYSDVAWDYDADKPIFKNGEPVIVTGIEAVRSWAYRAIRTRRYAQIQNSWDYGNDLHSLIGQPWQAETKIAEAKRYTEECLSPNPYITGIENFNAAFSSDTVNISFTLNTVYGKTALNTDVLLTSYQ